MDVNGEEVATESDIRGMFLRHSIDITQQAASAKKPSNSLELLIRPPKHVGCVDKGCAPQASVLAWMLQTFMRSSSSAAARGGHDIAKCCTAQLVEGLGWTLHVPKHSGCIEALIIRPVLLCSGQGGDHDIAKDCTAQFVEGWDWIVPVPDRNTGIWDDVDVKWTGPVLLQVLLSDC